ncbi:MAG: T9SS type A sorting domain-containing protein [Bacteroidetes bacterium]|nr:MAG: T9SS type A sorting domain-containing protein [Bacteroidota bacterium]
MKKLVLFTSILFISMIASAQIMFQKSYGEFAVDYGQAMVRTNDGGYCIVGGTGPDLIDSTDAMIIRTNMAGDLVSSTRLAGTKDDFITGITTTDDGGYIIVGNTYSSPLDTAYSDIVVMKIDDGGFVYWSKTFGSTDYDEAQSVIRSGDGGYIVLGSTMSYTSVTKSALAMKIDDFGNQVWTNTSDSYSSNYFYSGDMSADGNYIAVGGTFNGAGGTGFDNYISKIDTTGIILWSKAIGTASSEFLYDVKATSDGGYLACGVATLNTAGDADMSIIKLNATGDVVWTFNYGTAGYDRASSILQRANGEIMVAGYTNIGIAPDVINQMILMKLDSTGGILWTQSYGDISFTSEAYKLLETFDGYALCGYSIAFDPLGDAILVKTDGNGASGCYEAPITYVRTTTTLSTASGFLESVGIIDELVLTFNDIYYEDQFSLICYSVGIGEGPKSLRFEIYPNPASTYLKVKSVQGESNAKLSITDLTGRILISQDFSTLLEAQLPVDKLLSGMYLLNIETDKGLATKTFIKQ